MATTTSMGSNPKTTKHTNPTVYWVIGAVLLLALVLFYTMSTRVDRAVAPAPVTNPAVTGTTTDSNMGTTGNNAVGTNVNSRSATDVGTTTGTSGAVGTEQSSGTTTPLTPGTTTENATEAPQQ